MATIIEINHSLEYSYDEPVFIEPQSLRLTPQPGTGQRLLDFSLDINPRPSGFFRAADEEGNTLCRAWFDSPVAKLKVKSRARLEIEETNPFDFLVYPGEALRLPFKLEKGQASLLAAALAGVETSSELEDFNARLLTASNKQTLTYLGLLNQEISALNYELRDKGGVQSPSQTLVQGSGSCRDFAWLFVACCRALGMPARFVSGYHFDPRTSAELHAWAEVYIPFAGWRGFDPTAGIAATSAHIPLASSALPDRAAPLMGTFRASMPGKLHADVSIEAVNPC